jgi:hypothetical protein
MSSKLKPVLLLGIAGGIVAAVKRRASNEQIQQAASQAASTVSDIADRAKEAVTGNGDDLEATRAHEVPKDVVVPDTSNEDPAVQEAEADAAADAGAIGGSTT